MARIPGLGQSLIGPAMGFSSENFQIDSARVGDRFEISVTLPPGYRDDAATPYPVIYSPDTHTNCAMTVAATTMMIGDRNRPVQPYVLVNIGYADADMRESLILRNRDFAPPGEKVPEEMRRHIDGRGLSSEEVEAFMHHAQNGRADNFLAFLQEELHAEILRRYRVEPNHAGLFAHSYGGMFSLYAFTACDAFFNRICAASPGLLTDESQIYRRYKAMAAGGLPAGWQVDLFVTLSELEITGPQEMYRKLGVGTLRFIDLLLNTPLPGLRLGHAVFPNENHFSTVLEAFRGFVRHAYLPQTS